MEDGVDFVQLELGGGERFVPLRRLLGVSTFGINAIVLESGQRGRIHRHERQEEVYLVLEGELTLVLEGDEHRLERGGCARQPRPRAARAACARGREPARGARRRGVRNVGRDRRPSPAGSPAAGRRARRGRLIVRIPRATPAGVLP
jgi:hypothetical protein